jgi:lipoprotein NlpD
LRRWLAYSLMLFCLLACGGGYRAPVEERGAKPRVVPSSYSVRRGDTLFSIAWRYGLDYRQLARSNNISSPYTIYPGQKIYLSQKPPAKVKTSTSTTVSPVSKPPSSSTEKSPAPAPATPGPAPRKASPAGAAIGEWRWPTTGKVSRSYSSSVHKGIDISGARGDAIYAVAAGTVVYAGTGIVGYGELLIVKHNEVYLSAYGHNSRLLVGEGVQVRAGQKIAEKGSSGTDTVKLHFEIRKEGKPVDPKRLLPAR